METRKYRDTPDPGPVILTDILTTGKSEGWQGTIEELTALRELLAPFNVA